MVTNNQSESISQIKVGSEDSTGYTITNVLSRGNEFAIYEVEHERLENRLRVFIDGKTEDSERKLIDKFNIVKEDYILAKVLLYRASNFNLMKNRVAHVLASALTGNPNDAKEKFKDLVVEINKAYKSLMWRRVIYLSPIFVLLSIVTILIAVEYSYYVFRWSSFTWKILYITESSLIGAAFSKTYNVSSVRFEDELHTGFYLLIGTERILLAILAGVITFFAIKANVIFGFINNIESNIFHLLFVSIIAGFSERYIPGIMNRFLEEG